MLSACEPDEVGIATFEVENEEFIVPNESSIGYRIGEIPVESNQATLTYTIVSQEPAGSIEVKTNGNIYVLDANQFQFKNNESVIVNIEVSSGEISKTATITILIDELTEYDNEVITYFTNIALGFEFGSASEITRRWKDDMLIFVSGNASVELKNELNLIIQELNEIITTDFQIRTVEKQEDSNYHIYFGSHINYGNLYPSTANLAVTNWGLFTLWWNNNNELNFGRMYVDIVRANDLEQKHLLREELTQSLGLAKDSEKYSDSIFQQSFNTKVTEYSKIDIELIRLLYHPNMRTGLDSFKVKELLRQILISEK